MRTETPPMVKRADYRPYPFKIDQVRLRFDLSPDKTRVVSNLSGERTSGEHSPMQLHGEALKLVRVVLNGETLSDTQYELTPEGLSVPMKAGSFELEIETEIAPASNTELSGLYMSGGRFCTQCEAEGFRRITYYPDRPDVLARFHVHMEADASYPFLLSNGNPGKTGKLDNGRHFAEWDDPHPKPAYLFALVAGDFDVHRDSFTTRSNKDTPLAIFVDKGDADRAAYAMDSLKRSMRWDEDVFGREYDLDVFNIVAVRDFNFGAMENKGLNIFNSAYVLADGETATDADFEAIESIVGHEYFHNWTGNRITCRDWFQLCLKEGLTVYRDQEFSADMRSAAVTRIKDVIRLRARQFPEDAGPLAHAVRPDQYARIDNLYTATVYEKGAEIIRMLRAIIGDTAFFAGLNRYFDQHDGSAATIEDFLDAFRPSTDFDLDHFALWYSQPGTPTIEAKGEYEAISKTYRLTLKQATLPTPNQSEKAPFILPIRTALFSSNGQQLPAELNGKSGEDHLLILDTAEQEFVFEKVASAPIHSLNRGFSSAIKLDDGLNDATRSVLAASETDTFAQWESLQTLARSIMIDRTIGADKEGTGRVAAFVDAVDAAVKSTAKDPAYAALLLRLPSVGEMMLDMEEADPQALNVQRSKVKSALAKRMQGYLETLADQPSSDEFDPSAEAAGKRALKSAALDLLSALGDSQVDRIFDVFETASTMTESLAALSALGAIDDESFDEALDVFEGLWASAPLIMDKWFSVQATAVRSDTHDRIAKLATRKDFNLKNPNRVRALAAAFAMNNPVCFHDKSGAGYKFLADTILKVDPLNGALSARLATAFESWRKFSPDHREHAEAELKRLDVSSLSKNARDIVNRALAT